MFKAIVQGKTIAISEKEIEDRLICDSILEDTEHSVDDYAVYNDEYLLKSDIPAPSMEEQKEKRAQAYLLEVDPITAHIQRERDEKNPDENKVAELVAKRAKNVAENKERYPYPQESGDGKKAL